MQEACLFDILELPTEALKKVLPKAPARVLARLLTAYPRAVSQTFMDVLSQCVSQPTLNFLREEMVAAKIPSFRQIRKAEQELLAIINEEKIPLGPPAPRQADLLAAPGR